MLLLLLLLKIFTHFLNLSLEVSRLWLIWHLYPFVYIYLYPFVYIYPLSNKPVWGALPIEMGTGWVGPDTYYSLHPSLIPESLELPTRIRWLCSYYLSADLVSHVGLTVKYHVPIWRFIKCFEYLLITWASTLTVTKQFSRYPTLCKPYIPHWSLLWERVRWHKAPRVVNISWVEPVLHHWTEHVPSLDLSFFIRGCIDSALKHHIGWGVWASVGTELK